MNAQRRALSRDPRLEVDVIPFRSKDDDHGRMRQLLRLHCTALLCCRVSSRGDWIGPDRRGETDGHRRATGKAGGQGVVSPGEAAGRRSAKCCRTQQPPAPLPHASRQSFPVACCLSPSAATSRALFTSQKILQNFSHSPSHRIFRRMYRVLNIDENKN